MKPPSASTSIAARAPARTTVPVSRERASAMRVSTLDSRPRTHASFAARAKRSAHAAQYNLNQTNGQTNGPKPFMSEYTHPGSEP